MTSHTGTNGHTGVSGTSGQSATSGTSGTTNTGGGTGGTGAATGTTGFGCTGKSYTLCEDFESTSAGNVPAGWVRTMPYYAPGTGIAEEIGVSTASHHSGTQALRSSSHNPAQTRMHRSLSGLGNGSEQAHWGRIFYRVELPTKVPVRGLDVVDGGGDKYFHTTFVALTADVQAPSTDEGRIVDTVQSPEGTHQFLYNIPDDSFGRGSDYSYAFDDMWHCAEWYASPATSSYRFFIDGDEIASLAFNNTPAARMKNQMLAVGAVSYQDLVDPDPFTLWIDDLAIDTTQIGCQ
jgi:hypothetical protein